ncbi:MAG: GNAT family N-acetyltransferase [Anaerolineaceae bacterium]|nr:GNAT family N-acetyltransferase [Anaerolineaceae bacterium]
MNIPMIETKRLLLRGFQQADSEVLAGILAKENVVQYIGTGRSIPEEKIPLIIEKILEAWDKNGYGRWAVTLKSTGELIGWSGLEYLPDTGDTEILYLYDEPYWGKGYASEAAFASLRFWYEHTDLDVIIGLTYPENIPSQIILKKIGLKYVREAEYFGLNLFLYNIKRDDYLMDEKKLNLR